MCQHDDGWQTRFEAWKAAVDEGVAAVVGVTTDELEDRPYAELFDDGAAPSDVVEEIREELSYS